MSFVTYLEMRKPYFSLKSVKYCNNKLIKHNNTFYHKIQRSKDSNYIFQNQLSFRENFPLNILKFMNSKYTPIKISKNESEKSQEGKSDLIKKILNKYQIMNFNPTPNKIKMNDFSFHNGNITHHHSLGHKLKTVSNFPILKSRTGRNKNKSMYLNIPSPKKLSIFANDNKKTLMQIFNHQVTSNKDLGMDKNLEEYNLKFPNHYSFRLRRTNKSSKLYYNDQNRIRKLYHHSVIFPKNKIDISKLLFAIRSQNSKPKKKIKLCINIIQNCSESSNVDQISSQLLSKFPLKKTIT